MNFIFFMNITVKEASEFSQFIETKAYKDNVTCLEALVEFIEDKEVDIEKIKNLISPSLRDKLRENFIDRGMLRPEQTLNDFFENFV